jgi:hypothetical protein
LYLIRQTLRLTQELQCIVQLLRTASGPLFSDTAAAAASTHNGAASADSSATATAAQLSGQWPRLLFLLRDRILHCPQQADTTSTSTASSTTAGSSKSNVSALQPILQLLQQRERSGVLLAAADEGLCQEVRNGYIHT